MSVSPISIGVSACLLGEKVRYDGGHKHDRVITEGLGRHCNLVLVCPEVECGLPVPREVMRLEGEPETPCLLTIETRRDLTEQMRSYCREKMTWLAEQQLSGLVLKKNSPSCGLWRVTVIDQGEAVKRGRGLFAHTVLQALPLLPVADELQLHEPERREQFIEKVFAYRRWQNFVAGDGTLGGLVTFHSQHKYQLMAHHPVLYRALGKLVAAGKEANRSLLLEQYGADFMRCLGYQATAKKNSDVLLHIMGYFKRNLTGGEKAEIAEVIADYRRGLVPLLLPLVLLRHYVRRFDQPYLRDQTYLAARPGEKASTSH